MELVPWKPFREITSFRKEMDNLLNRFFTRSPLAETWGEEWLPSMDITEGAANIVVQAELPGLEAKDLDISLTEDVLTIKGEKKKDGETKDEHHHYSERYYGAFQRSFRLPASVQADKIEARFEKGVLKITLPKSEEAKKKEIKVKVQ